jgi:hypothetical protein
MTPKNRRVFALHLAASAAALVAGTASAQAKRLAESDPQAVALGYREDSRNVDAKKFPRHAPTQNCTNCTIWISKGAEGGNCHLYGSRLLSGTGWCSQWVAKG